MSDDNRRALLLAAVAEKTKQRDNTEKLLREHEDSIAALKRQLAELDRGAILRGIAADERR